jgi:hypothetical protein
VNRGEHEHRDLAVGFLLVFGVIGPRFHRALPPRGLLVAEDLAGFVLAVDGPVLAPTVVSKMTALPLSSVPSVPPDDR